MNYDAAFITFIEQIKADKSIVQPWRNKACARLEEVQAFVRMGKTTTYEKPPEPVCNCPDPKYAKRANCPVHGELAA
ncbi:MAG TPA: hypothetical protein VNG51_19340 [Ktedonobacteraceae bacterium]|nr:hypothetical protein [Ktedonobacteraceae bacterium]